MISPGQWTTTDQLLAWTGLTGLAGGLVLFVVGRRGRRLDLHPVCRKCGFDLFGKPESSFRCAECGADLNRRRAVRLGNRSPRKRCAWIGAMLAVLSLAAFVWPVLHYSRRFDLIRHLPLTWLMEDVDSIAPAVRDPAVAELIRRIKAGEISTAQQTWLTGRLLKIQTFSLPTFSTPLDSILVSRIKAGWASDAQLDQFAIQCKSYLQRFLTPVPQMKSKLRRGQRLGLLLNFDDVRWIQATDFGMPVQLDYLIVGLKVDDKPVTGEFGSRRTVLDSTSKGDRTPWSILPNWNDIADLPDGQHTFSIVTRVSAWFSASDSRPLNFDIESSLEIRLLPREGIVDQFFAEKGRGQVVEDALSNGLRIVRDRSGAMQFKFPTASDRYVRVAMDAWVTWPDGTRQLMGRLRSDRGAYQFTELGSRHPKGVSDPIDINLTPSQDAADEAISIDTYWGEPVLLRNIRVFQMLPANP